MMDGVVVMLDEKCTNKQVLSQRERERERIRRISIMTSSQIEGVEAGGEFVLERFLFDAGAIYYD